MTHVVTRPTPPFEGGGGAFEVHQVPVWNDNLVWLLVCKVTGCTAAVDGPEAGPVIAYCEQQGLNLTHVLNTHTHADHIGINRGLAKRDLLKSMIVYGPTLARSAVPGITHPVSEGDTARVGNLSGRVLLTEGHINGHVSYVFDDVLFCGDTLFAGGCGYLFDGPPRKMFDSLTRLAQLSEPTRVCCGHEYTQDNLRFAWSVDSKNPDLAARIRDVWSLRARGECSLPSTIGMERRTNPFLRGQEPELRAALERAWGRRVEDAETAFTLARALKDRKDYKSMPDDQFPL